MEAKSLSSCLKCHTLYMPQPGFKSQSVQLDKACTLQKVQQHLSPPAICRTDDSSEGGMEIGMLVAESPKSSKIKLGTFFRKKGKADSFSDRGVCKKPGSCAVAQEPPLPWCMSAMN